MHEYKIAMRQHQYALVLPMHFKMFCLFFVNLEFLKQLELPKNIMFHSI